MKKYCFRLLCLAGLFGSATVLAQIANGGLEVAVEHARIQAERQQIEKRFADEEVACFQKFAVNDCRDASRARRRVEMADLRRQEIALNDAERKRKGAEQLQRMEQSAAAKDQPPPAAGTATPRGSAAPPARTHAPTEPHKPSDPAEAAKAQAARKATTDNKARRYQEEQAARAHRAAAAAAANEPARYAKKLQEAADHKADTEKRNAAQTKAKSAPLPEPAP